MKKRILFLGVLLFTFLSHSHIWAQPVTMEITSNPSSVNVYTFASGDKLYRTDLANFSWNSSSNVCGTATHRFQDVGFILELVSTSLSAIDINGGSSGSSSNRVISKVEIGDANNGPWQDITALADTTGQTGTSSTCGVARAEGLSIPVGKFVKFTFDGNARFSSFVVYPVGGCTMPSVFEITGSTTICSGTTNVSLDGSEDGAHYQLYKDDAAFGEPIEGDGDPLSWTVSETGIYTVKTTTDGGYCELDMNGEAAIVIDGAAPQITAQSTATATYYQGQEDVASLTVTTPVGMSYQWYRNTVASNAGGTSVGAGNGGQTNEFTPPTNVIGTSYYYCVVSSPCGPDAVSSVSGAIVVEEMNFVGLRLGDNGAPTTTSSSYTFDSGDILHTADGSNFTSVGTSPNCGGASHRAQFQTVVLELVNTSASTISVLGASSGGSARTIRLVETSDELDGDYTVVEDIEWENSTITSTILGGNTTCGVASVSGLNIPLGKFVRITFSTSSSSLSPQNVRVSGFDITPVKMYRTTSSGSWDNVSNWEVSTDGLTWSDATNLPDESATDVRVLHEINFASDVVVESIDVTATGGLSLGNNNLTVNAITGSENGYVVLNGTGVLTINNVGGNSDVLFPVGPSTTLYHPVVIKNSGDSDNFSVSVKSNYPDQCSDVVDVDDAKSLQVVWDISEAVPGGTNATITFNFEGAIEGENFDPGTAKVVHCGSSRDIGELIDYANKTVTVSGISDFSPFIITNDSEALPVKLTTFTAARLGSRAKLNWHTAMEENTKGFEILRAVGNENFEPIGFVHAGQYNYEFTDLLPGKGHNHYRLRIVDLDDKVEWSAIQSVDFSDLSIEAAVRIYPTVATEKIFVQVNGIEKAPYVIFNLSGQPIQKGILTSGVKEITVQSLPAGVYMMRVGEESLKFIKQ